MANPNIVNVSSIYGKTAVQAVTNSATAIVENTAASGKIIKINALSIANVNGVDAADITVDLYRGSTGYRLANTISVPADASLIVISKDTYIYLEEGDSLRCLGSDASSLEAVCSYEEIG